MTHICDTRPRWVNPNIFLSIHPHCYLQSISLYFCLHSPLVTVNVFASSYPLCYCQYIMYLHTPIVIINNLYHHNPIVALISFYLHISTVTVNNCVPSYPSCYCNYLCIFIFIMSLAIFVSYNYHEYCQYLCILISPLSILLHLHILIVLSIFLFLTRPAVNTAVNKTVNKIDIYRVRYHYSHQSGHCDVINNRVWRRQHNVNRPSAIRDVWRL